MDPGSIVEDTKRTRFRPQMDGPMGRQTDGQTDRQGDFLGTVKPSAMFAKGNDSCSCVLVTC